MDAAINAVGFYEGGDYTLIHNTIGYSNQFGFKRDNPALVSLDFYEYASNQFTDDELKVNYINNLIFGGRSNEFSYLLLNRRPSPLPVVSGNAIRTDTNKQSLTDAGNSILNFQFRFYDQSNGDFSYDSLKTPAKKGVDITNVTNTEVRNDFYGKPRDWPTPDPGAINAKRK
jgi:hypothetical protein